jgi:hypothetical protein
MSLLPFVEWLHETPGSVALRESLYMYPLTESFHVWTLALFVGFAALLDLRLTGMLLKTVPVTEVMRRSMPWMIAGFVIMVVTGVMLFYAIPIRSYQNIFFRVKVILLLLAGLNVFVFHYGIWQRVTDWNLEGRPPRRARLAGFASLVLWGCIIFAGRMIAYNWFDCDRQPQPAWVNWAAGCVEAE